jgi:hypothetical protein
MSVFLICIATGARIIFDVGDLKGREPAASKCYIRIHNENGAIMSHGAHKRECGGVGDGF